MESNSAGVTGRDAPAVLRTWTTTSYRGDATAPHRACRSLSYGRRLGHTVHVDSQHAVDIRPSPCVAPSLTIPCGKTNRARGGTCFDSFNFSVGAQVVNPFELTQQTVKNFIRD